MRIGGAPGPILSANALGLPFTRITGSSRMCHGPVRKSSAYPIRISRKMPPVSPGNSSLGRNRPTYLPSIGSGNSTTLRMSRSSIGPRRVTVAKSSVVASITRTRFRASAAYAL